MPNQESSASLTSRKLNGKIVFLKVSTLQGGHGLRQILRSPGTVLGMEMFDLWGDH